MSKKAKIITSAICIGLVIVGLAITIILVTLKRFDITPNSEVILNNHTEMIESGYDGIEYSAVSATINNNATKIIKNAEDKMGVYSYINRTFVIPTEHESITVARENVGNGVTYYKTSDTIAENAIINLFDDHGSDIGIVEYDRDKAKNYTYIKQKYVKTVASAGSVKASTKNKFSNEKKYIVQADIMNVYYDVDRYWYETWKLTCEDGTEYTNLYQIKNGNRSLIQTINNDIGLKPEEKNLQLFFSKNGTPRLVKMENTGTHPISNKFTVYDINYNKLGVAEINDIQAEYINKYFQIGDSLFVQCLVPTDSKKYDLQITPTGETLYYNVDTYKINIKSGKINKVRFKYVVVNVNTDFNNETALLTLVKIKGKKAEIENAYVVNERLQTRVVDYTFDNITKISKNHYIASTGDTNFYLIGKNYNILARLDNYTSYFTTENAIILKGLDEYAYVCNHEGNIVAKYLATDIENTYSTKYYSVKETVVEGGQTRISYYLENLGIREQSPYMIDIDGSTAHTFNGIEYAFAKKVFTPSSTLIIRIKDNGGLYTYDFYSINGTLLNSVENLMSSGYTISEVYSDKTHSLIAFEGHYFTLNR